MPCRCQERRQALKRAVTSRSVDKAANEMAFVIKSAAVDIRRSAGGLLVRKGKPDGKSQIKS
jgi:hypothetical protein